MVAEQNLTDDRMEQATEQAIFDDVRREIESHKTPESLIAFADEFIANAQVVADMLGVSKSAAGQYLSGKFNFSHERADDLRQGLYEYATYPLRVRRCPRCGKVRALTAFELRLGRNAEQLGICVTCDGRLAQFRRIQSARAATRENVKVIKPSSVEKRMVSAEKALAGAALSGELLRLATEYEEREQAIHAKLAEIRELRVQLGAMRELLDRAERILSGI
jgi:hypothetical protein